VVLMIDGIHFGGQVLVVALGIAEGGEKHVLGVWQGATENTTVVKGLLEDLVDRGLDLKRRYLVVMVAENLPATGKDQSNCVPESGGRAGRNADGASLGCRSGVAAVTGYHQPDRIMSFDGAASGTQRKTLARRKSAAALDRYRPFGSREKVSAHRRLSRNSVAEGTPESVAHSAAGGSKRRSRLNLVRGKLTVPNIESRCNQLKFGHPLALPLPRKMDALALDHSGGVSLGLTLRNARWIDHESRRNRVWPSVSGLRHYGLHLGRF
jgi:hypothetical protein